MPGIRHQWGKHKPGAPPTPPQFSVAPSTATVEIDDTIFFQAVDPLGFPVAYSLPGSPTGYSIAANGMVTVGAGATSFALAVKATATSGLSAQVVCNVTVTTQQVGSVWPTQTDPGYLPIVPDGRGWGMETTAGSGRATSIAGGNNFGANPTILFVDSLSTATSGSLNGDGTGQGTFKWCVMAQADGGAPVSGARTVIPLVSGIINYGTSGFIPTASKLTLAMQCAPSPGLYIFGASFTISGNDILLWHANTFFPYNPKYAYHTRSWDGSSWQRVVHANCGAFWNRDEGFGVWSITENNGGYHQDTDRFTFWQCMVGEPVGEQSDPSSSTYGLGKCHLLHVYNHRNSSLRNAFLHAYERQPRTCAAEFTFADNLIYNLGGYGTQVAGHPDLTAIAANPSGWPTSYLTTPKTNVEANIYLTGTYDLNSTWTNTFGRKDCIWLQNDGNIDPRPQGTQDFVSGNVSVGRNIGGTGADARLVTSRISAAYPPGYKTLPLVGGADDGTQRSNLTDTDMIRIRDKAELILAYAGPYPGRRLARVQQIVDGALARLRGDPQSSWGTYTWLAMTPKRFPLVSDLGTVAENSISVSAAKSTAWNGDPVPYVDSGAMHNDNSGYTVLERWLHRRNEEVMP
jgi:hypothetical protein